MTSIAPSHLSKVQVKNSQKTIGQSKHGSVMPLIAFTVFVLGMTLGVVLPSIVKDEERQAEALSVVSTIHHEVAQHQEKQPQQF